MVFLTKTAFFASAGGLIIRVEHKIIRNCPVAVGRIASECSNFNCGQPSPSSQKRPKIF